MPLPSKITRSLLRATCDKTALNKRILLYRRCFLEVHQLLSSGVKDSRKKK